MSKKTSAVKTSSTPLSKPEVKSEDTKVEEAPKARPGSFAALISQ